MKQIRKSPVRRDVLKVCILVWLYVFISATEIAQALTEQLPAGGKKISPHLFGMFFEDVNYSADGGLYAELVQDRSLEYNSTDQRE